MTPEDFKSARATLAIPQRVMAERLGVTRAHLSRLETGTATPSATLVKLVECILGQREGGK